MKAGAGKGPATSLPRWLLYMEDIIPPDARYSMIVKHNARSDRGSTSVLKQFAQVAPWAITVFVGNDRAKSSLVLLPPPSPLLLSS